MGKPSSFRRFSARALVLCLAACTPEASTPRPSSDSKSATPSVEPASAPPPTPSAATPASSAALEAEARALLTSWEAAQDRGDFAAYEQLYAQRFTGVKRSGPRTRNFGRAGWLKDRQRMFAKPMQVDFRAESVVDQGATVAIVGSQSFHMAGYEDRGPKRFLLAREGAGLRIVREEMLASELGPAPTLAARMVVDVAGGPLLVILGRATAAAAHGERAAVQAGYPSAVVYAAGDGASAPAEAKDFLDKPVQLVGAGGACSTRGKALRVAHIAYAHFGQVAAWRGEDPTLPRFSADELSEQIRTHDAVGFWAVELENRCVPEPLVAVPGGHPVQVIAKRALAAADQTALRARFSKLPSVRALDAIERTQALEELTFTRFGSGQQEVISAESISGCSAPVVHALFHSEFGEQDLGRAAKLGFGGDQGVPEHVEAVADLDGDGQPEVIARSAIGADTWGVVDLSGRERVVLSLPYFDCPC
jgi:hypothetical protein